MVIQVISNLTLPKHQSNLGYQNHFILSRETPESRSAASSDVSVEVAKRVVWSMRNQTKIETDPHRSHCVTSACSLKSPLLRGLKFKCYKLEF